MHAPHWLQKALLNRFDDLSHKVQTIPEIIELQLQLEQLLQQLTHSWESSNRDTFLAWEEKTNAIHVMQSEWLYMKGIQDGLEMLSLRYLMNEVESVVD